MALFQSPLRKQGVPSDRTDGCQSRDRPEQDPVRCFDERPVSSITRGSSMALPNEPRRLWLQLLLSAGVLALSYMLFNDNWRAPAILTPVLLIGLIWEHFRAKRQARKVTM